MTFMVIQGRGQGQEMTSVPCRDYFVFIWWYSIFVFLMNGCFLVLDLVSLLIAKRLARKSISKITC